MAKAPSRAGVGAPVYKAPVALWPAEAGMDSTMAGSEALQSATALIEERLAQEEENEVWVEVWVPKGVLRRSSSAVRGRKRLAATPVVEGGQVSLGLHSSQRVSWWRGLAVGDLRHQP